MKKLQLLTIVLSLCLSLPAWAVTYVYFENSTSQDFTVSSVQTGTHTLDSDEWWYSTAPVPEWRDETNVLWVNRDEGIHWGDDFFLTTTLTCADFSIQLKLKLYGEFIGSTIWSAAAGPGFSHSWTSDNNFHTALFSVNGKTYELKYTFYFTGGNDDILYTLHEFDAFSSDPAELSDPDVMNVLAYNTYMLTPPIALSDQGTRAQHIDEAVHDLDALLIQEVFDNSARATLLSQLSAEYPYQTPVVDLPNILEDGGIMIASRWPIEYYEQMVWNNCNEPDCLANKGVMYARINKLGRKYHLFSTHQQAFNGTDDVAVRNLQMQQFNAFIDAQNIPADEAVIFGGDMNVDKWTNKQGEYDNMLSIFNASAPTYIGHPYTWDKYTNHYIDAGAEAPEYLDYVLADNDYLDPIDQSNTVWIMRSNHNDMWNIHDLSDHHAVHGRFVFPPEVDPCASTVIDLTTEVTDESFEGAGDGSIDLTVAGGTAPYSYSWSNSSSSEDISGLAPGDYTVDVTDANGCTGSTLASVGTAGGCTAASDNFSANPLTHAGSGSASTTLMLPAGSIDASFTVSEINEKISGKADRRYIELVTVTYVDGNGDTQLYGTYSGTSVSTASVSIAGPVRSVTVGLEDIYSGSTASTMSVALSAVDFCEPGAGCPDSDGDGVCDADDACPGQDDALIGTSCDDGDACTVNDTYDGNCGCSGTYADADGDGVCDGDDICPGGDDNIDSDSDGIPDFCDNDCTVSAVSFPANPLTHSGSGSSSTTVTLPAGSTDGEFTISGIDELISGKPANRFLERVTVTYVDGNGATQSYGTFDGGGTAVVLISGPLQSVTVSLEDGYDGDAPGTLSVVLGDVSICSPAARVAYGQAALSDTRVTGQLSVFPNPVRETLHIETDLDAFNDAWIRIYSVDGKGILEQQAIGSSLDVDVRDLVPGIYILQLQKSDGELQTVKFIRQ